MMYRITTLLVAALFSLLASAQTLNVQVGDVIYQVPASKAGDMLFNEGESITIMDKVYELNSISQMFVGDTSVADSTVSVVYDGASAQVFVAGNVARYLTVGVTGAHVSIAQSDDLPFEITYTLSGSSDDGEFYMSGSYKATVSLSGLTLTNPNGAPINIQNGKRIQISAKRDTENTLTDGSNGNQKGCIYSKGQIQLQGNGTLTVYGNTAHAIKSGDYISMKNLTLNILSAAKDGISCNEYFLMKSGTLNISGTGDDGIQVDLDGEENTGETADHEDEDSGNIYIEDGTINITVTADAAKGMKAAGDVKMSGGKLTVTQSGGITTTGDLSYPTSIKSEGDINITGGDITIVNTGDGGKGMSADGAISIDESKATVNIDITANGKGGSATITEEEGGGEEEQTVPTSYKVYVSLPAAGGYGGGNPWTTLYLYKSDGTQVAQLTSTVTKSSGTSTATFYYYDFGAADSGTYYFKSADYTSRAGGSRTYAIVSETFSGPSSGSDYYYAISNSYTTSGTTRTYKITNVTTTYGGGSDTVDEGTDSYNAMGIKADGNLTIGGGTITVRNSGAMSKSLKSKAVLTINGGNVTLTPSGAMQVINNDASYSSGIKTVDFVQNAGVLTINASGTAGKGISATNITTNGGTLTITNKGGAQAANSGDYYTAKGMKADGYMKLIGGTIGITMSGNGGKGIKVNGTYTQGVSGGEGPTLTVTTTGSAAGSSSGGGGMWGGGQSSLSGTAKAIKVMNAITIYGGTTEVYTSTDGAEGLESKHSIDIQGGQHYFKCYDDCINCSKKETGATGKIFFNGGVTVCYSNGNDAVDSNAGTTGAITIGDGAVFAYTTRGAPEEGIDCDNNSYIQITGTGYAISAGGAQGGGSSSSSISNAKQGYAFVTSTISYQSGRYYTLADASGTNLVTYSFPASFSSTLALFTAKGMVKGTTYYVKYSTTAPTDATTAWHGLYLGSSAKGTTSVTSFSAK